MNEQDKQEKSDLLSDVKSTGELATSIDKLYKEYVDVTFYKNQSALDLFESDENQLRLRLKDEKNEEIIKMINDGLEEIKKQKEVELKNVVHARLVPLKYRDKRIVQTFINEAMISTEGMNFDIDARMIMVLQEKKFSTIYIALRKQNNINEKVFSLDEIADVSITTINNLYEEYNKAFNLSDNEIKK